MKIAELFGNLIFVVLINAVVVALIMETIKKALGEAYVKAGRRYIACNMKTWILQLVALVLSAGAAVISYMGGLTIGEPPIIFLYVLPIYYAQKEIDMRLVKKIINKICDKILNEI